MNDQLIREDDTALTSIFDVYWKHLQEFLNREERLDYPLIYGIQDSTVVDLLSHLPGPFKERVSQSVLTKKMLYLTAYSNSKAAGVANVIFIVPALITQTKPDVLKKLGKDPDKISLPEWQLARQQFPEAFLEKESVQFHLDLGGKFYHAFCEIFPNNTLGEYVITGTKSPSETSDLITSARKTVYRTTRF